MSITFICCLACDPTHVIYVAYMTVLFNILLQISDVGIPYMFVISVVKCGMSCNVR